MHDAFRIFLLVLEAAPAEDLEHSLVFRQDFGPELRYPFLPGKHGQVPQYIARDAKSMIVFFDHKGDGPDKVDFRCRSELLGR